MKTFNDLVFEDHPTQKNPITLPGRKSFRAIMSKMFFENGYGISVVSGPLLYTDNENEFEIAVLRGNENEFDLAYDTDITDDVIGHLSKIEVSEIMERVQALKNIQAQT